jgi:4-amino-4-deoxy-L-arabinose transferase-like glycosyltransferase
MPPRIANTLWFRFLIIALILLVAKIVLSIYMADLHLRGDENSYLRISKDFFRQYWDSPNYFGPLQSAFLAILRLFVSDSELVGTARFIQICIHTFSAMILFLIGRELKDDRVGFTAGILYLVLPETIFMSFMLFSETWAVFWILTSTWLYLQALSKNKLQFLWGAGFAFAITSLFRPIWLYFFPFMVMHLWLFYPNKTKNKLLGTVFLVLAVAAPVSIQTYKNYLIFGDMLLISTSGANSIWKAHNTFPLPKYQYGERSTFYHEKKKGFPGARPRVRTSTPARAQHAEMMAAVKFVVANPFSTIQRSFQNLYDLFHPSFYIYNPVTRMPEDSFSRRFIDGHLQRRAFGLSYVLMMMLSSVGLLFCRERRLSAFTCFLLGYHILMYTVVFYAATRFRMAFVPFLVLYMGWALANLGEIKERRFSWRHILLISLWLLMLISWWPVFQNRL